MSPEIVEQAKIEADAHFSEKEINVLQGLVDGFTKKQFEEVFKIPPLVLEAVEGSLAERFCRGTKTNGLYRAIVEAIRQDKLDTERLPGYPNLTLTEVDAEILGMMYKGERRSDWDFRRLEMEICRRLNVRTGYMAVAWVAKELKR